MDATVPTSAFLWAVGILVCYGAFATGLLLKCIGERNQMDLDLQMQRMEIRDLKAQEQRSTGLIKKLEAMLVSLDAPKPPTAAPHNLLQYKHPDELE